MASKRSPFDYVSAVSQKKDIVYTGEQSIEDSIAGYTPFITNKALSYHYDALGAVMVMNLVGGNLDKRLQYDFYINILRQRPRYGKWAKIEEKETIELVARYYGCSMQVAKSYMGLLSSDQLDNIRSSMEVGGENG